MESDTTNPITLVAVLITHVITKGCDSLKQFLVQWKDKPIEEASWEEEFNFRSQFPSFRLEDKSVIQGGETMTGLHPLIAAQMSY